MSPELIIAYLALCLVAGFLGRNRRIGFWGFLFCSMIVTPVVSLLFLYFATPRRV
jgi:Na+/melibiose symporter-like transporter